MRHVDLANIQQKYVQSCAFTQIKNTFKSNPQRKRSNKWMTTNQNNNPTTVALCMIVLTNRKHTRVKNRELIDKTNNDTTH